MYNSKNKGQISSKPSKKHENEIVMKIFGVEPTACQRVASWIVGVKIRCPGTLRGLFTARADGMPLCIAVYSKTFLPGRGLSLYI